MHLSALASECKEPSLFITPNPICIDVKGPYRDSGCASMDHVGKADVGHHSHPR